MIYLRLKKKEKANEIVTLEKTELCGVWARGVRQAGPAHSRSGMWVRSSSSNKQGWPSLVSPPRGPFDPGLQRLSSKLTFHLPGSVLSATEPCSSPVPHRPGHRALQTGPAFLRGHLWASRCYGHRHAALCQETRTDFITTYGEDKRVLGSRWGEGHSQL